MQQYLNKFGKDVRVDPDADEHSPDRCFPWIDYPGEMERDKQRYYSPQAMQQEWQKLWRRQWTIAGRLSDVENRGDYFVYELGRESFIITRIDDKTIKAYYNVCHHRGSRLVYDQRGNVPAFSCPFHGWTWALDGELKRITDIESFKPGVVCDRPPMTEVACDTWQGFVFINPDCEAPPLLEQVGDLDDIMSAYNMQDMALVNDIETLWPANWKTVMDAFMEGYHAQRRHPELLRYIDDYHFQYDLYAHGSSRMIIPTGVKSPRYKNPEILTDEMRDLAEPFGMDITPYENNATEFRDALGRAKLEWASNIGLDFSHFTDSQLADDWNINLFPNITFNAHPEGVLVMRFRPHPTDPEQCFYDVWILAHQVDRPDYKLPAYMPVADNSHLRPGSPRPERIFARLGETSFGLVLDQDAETVPFVQLGMHSEAFRGLRLSEQEVRLKHYYHEYNRIMGE